jgi:transcription initiation factor TFIIA large subunit
MPWDPKPAPPVQQQPQQVQQHHQQQQQQQQPIHNAGLPNSSANGMPPVSYGGYQNSVPAPSNGAARVKTESGIDQQQQQQYHGLPPISSYPQINGGQGGGAARAQQLVEQQFGPGATANFQRGGLALPGQQNAKPQPQGLQLPPNNPQQMQNHYQQQQHQAMQQRQQQQLSQQQQNPQIKIENNNNIQNGAQTHYQQQSGPNYSQTDGADDALEEWRAMLAERRAIAANETERANRLMRERIAALSDDLQSGLMLPLDEQQGRLQARRREAAALKGKLSASSSSTVGASIMPAIAQMDGEAADDEEDEDAINSDLDDPEDETNQINDDDDDNGDTILCTYDKVQRVKNKWKCTLKDGVLNANGKEWLFHKGNGEFEW